MSKNRDSSPFIHEMDHLARGFHERKNTRSRSAEYGSEKCRIIETLSI